LLSLLNVKSERFLKVQIDPISGALGAEITGVDLSELSTQAFKAVNQALLEHQVIFFPFQNLSTTEHRDFAKLFGELDTPKFSPPFDTPKVKGHPEIYQLLKEADDQTINVGGFWHADVTHRERPHKLSVIYVKESPDYGGDTLFSNLYMAYETLSEGMKNMLEGMKAVHSSEMPFGGAEARSSAISRSHNSQSGNVKLKIENVEGEFVETLHPVIRTHPETNRKLLYVNRGFTSHFEGMTREESFPLLDYLWKHCERSEFTCRYRWKAGSLGIWDNRCVNHNALNDYYGQRRLLHRISVNEEIRPQG